jgi:hypothetical protein
VQALLRQLGDDVTTVIIACWGRATATLRFAVRGLPRVIVATIPQDESAVRAVVGDATVVGLPRDWTAWHLPHLRNVGIKWAAAQGADHVTFHDADVIAPLGYVELVSEMIAEYPDKVLVPVLEREGVSRPASGLATFPVGPLVAVRGFDEAYPGWGQEDLDVLARLKWRGVGHVLIPELGHGLTHLDHSTNHRSDALARESLVRWRNADPSRVVNPDGWGRMLP